MGFDEEVYILLCFGEILNSLGYVCIFVSK